MNDFKIGDTVTSNAFPDLGRLIVTKVDQYIGPCFSYYEVRANRDAAWAEGHEQHFRRAT